MTTRPVTRSLALAVLALSTQACLFLNDPSAINNTANNPNELCFDVTCLPGKECEPSTGECVDIRCTFSKDLDSYQSGCEFNTVCHLDRDGEGFCAPPCATDRQCPSGSYCDPKFELVLGPGNGICRSEDTVAVNCQNFSGICLSDEFCDLGECIFDDPFVCFSRPGGFDDPSCFFQPCDFFEGDPDRVCDLGTDLPTACHIDSNAPEGEPSGYCYELCQSDNECTPGASCGQDGVCAPDGDEPLECKPWEILLARQCVPKECNAPNEEAGDRSCDAGAGEKIYCIDPPNSLVEGLCWPDCTTLEPGINECPGIGNMICNDTTGRCELRGG